MLLPSGTALYLYDLKSRELSLISQPDDVATAKLSAKLSPCSNTTRDELMVAYVCNNDIYVAPVFNSNGAPARRLTFAADEKKTAGVAEYIMQEEFSRYTGFWWSHKKVRTKRARKKSFCFFDF